MAIMVLGQSGRGAVKAAMSGKSVPGQISALFAPIRLAVERAGSGLDAAIKVNARIDPGGLVAHHLAGDRRPCCGGQAEGRCRIRRTCHWSGVVAGLTAAWPWPRGTSVRVHDKRDVLCAGAQNPVSHCASPSAPPKPTARTGGGAPRVRPMAHPGFLNSEQK
jgi:hypothetical protein